MDWKKRLLAAALACMLAFAGAGCGEDAGGGGTAYNAPECMALLEKAQERMAGLESVRSEVTAVVELSMGKEKTEYVTTLETAMTTEPFRLQISLSEQADGDEECYAAFAEADGGGYAMYVDAGGTWVGKRMGKEEMSQSDARGNLGLYLAGMEDCRETGYTEAAYENGDSIRHICIQGVIRGETMAAAIQASASAANALETLGMTVEEVQESVPEMRAAAWIDEEGYVAAFELDGDEVLDFIMGRLDTQGRGQIKAERFWTYMAFSDFNGVGEIEIPAEAREAAMLGD